MNDNLFDVIEVLLRHLRVYRAEHDKATPYFTRRDACTCSICTPVQRLLDEVDAVYREAAAKAIENVLRSLKHDIHIDRAEIKKAVREMFSEVSEEPTSSLTVRLKSTKGPFAPPKPRARFWHRVFRGHWPKREGR